MNIIVEIDSENVREKVVHSKNGPFTIRQQTGWVTLPGKRYPIECDLSLEEGQPPHAKGTYRVSENSVFVNRYKQLEISRKLELEQVDKDSEKAIVSGRDQSV